MYDKKFKIIVALLISIFLLLIIIFFGKIFHFFASIFLGVIGFFTLTAIFISSLKMEDVVIFSIFFVVIAVTFYLVKIGVKQEIEKNKRIAKDREFLNVDVQNAIDDLFDNTLTLDSQKLIDVFIKASLVDSSDWRVAYSSYLLGYIYSTESFNVLDVNKALRNYAIALSKGIAAANLALGKIYYNGAMVEKNYDLAFDYFEKCKKKFPSESYLYLGLILRDKAIKNLDKKDQYYKKAVDCLKKSMSATNPKPLASFKLGAMTYLGEGIDKNYGQAYSLMYDAVTTCIDAEVVYLSEMYFYGRGIEINYGRALYYAIMANKFEAKCEDFVNKILNNAADYEAAEAYCDAAYSCSDNKNAQHIYLNKSHKLGNSNATIQIATLYLNGENEYYKLDSSKAYELLKPLSDIGNPNAQTMLSRFYFEGDVVEKNNSEGLRLLTLAADQGYVTAIGLLAHQQTLDVGKISEGSFNLYKKAADLGNAYCCYVVGDTYLNGYSIDGVYEELDFLKKNPILAIEYLDKGAQLENDDCQFLLGTIYYYGHDSINVDYIKSLAYFKQCVEGGGEYACKYLGIQNDLGLGIPVNYNKAIYFYFKFLEKYSDATVFHNISSCYLNGNGIAKDGFKAIEYFEKAAMLGNKPSVLALAYIYFEGTHVVKDLIKSLTWFYVASLLEFNEAFEELKKIKEQISSEGIEKAKKNANIIFLGIAK